jgi:hypothetical protein
VHEALGLRAGAADDAEDRPKKGDSISMSWKVLRKMKSRVIPQAPALLQPGLGRGW